MLPSKPLLELLGDRRPVLSNGRVLAVSTVKHWRTEGKVLLWSADEVCTALGVHPVTVFGDVWFDTGPEQTDIFDHIREGAAA